MNASQTQACVSCELRSYLPQRRIHRKDLTTWEELPGHSIGNASNNSCFCTVGLPGHRGRMHRERRHSSPARQRRQRNAVRAEGRALARRVDDDEPTERGHWHVPTSRSENVGIAHVRAQVGQDFERVSECTSMHQQRGRHKTCAGRQPTRGSAQAAIDNGVRGRRACCGSRMRGGCC